MFSDSEFKGFTSFNNSQFKEDVFFENASFTDLLYLTQTKYDKLYIKWSNVHKLAYDETAYQLLIENFRKLGLSKDADNCYYDFRVDRLLHSGPQYSITEAIITKLGEIHKKYSFGISDIVDTIFDVGAWFFYGYGKKPYYPLLWSIFSISMFCVFWIAVSLSGPKEAIAKYGLNNSWPRRAFSLFFIAIVSILWRVIRLEKSMAEIDEYDQVGKWPSTMIEALIFSFTVFLSGTKLFVDPPAVPVLPGRSKSLIKRAFVLERILGAFFSILLFLAIGATVVR